MNDIPISYPEIRDNLNLLANNFSGSTSTVLSQVVSAAQDALKNLNETSVYIYSLVQAKVLSTSFSPIIKKTSSVCNDAEKIFNIGSSMPWVGYLSGTLRTLFGQLQAVSGIALTALSELGLVIANFSKADDKLVSQWRILSKTGIELTVHGCLNFLRGSGEALIGALHLASAMSHFCFPISSTIAILLPISNMAR